MKALGSTPAAQITSKAMTHLSAQLVTLRPPTWQAISLGSLVWNSVINMLAAAVPRWSDLRLTFCKCVYLRMIFT